MPRKLIGRACMVLTHGDASPILPGGASDAEFYHAFVPGDVVMIVDQHPYQRERPYDASSTWSERVNVVGHNEAGNPLQQTLPLNELQFLD